MTVLRKMKMRYILFFALIVVSLILISSCVTPTRILQAGQFVLKPGESITSADGSTKVTFVELAEDSRCATGVECVWAGQVKVLLEITFGTEIQQYTLVSGTKFEGNLDSIDIGDYSIRLTQVDPYPVYGQDINPADYRVTLDIR